MRDLLNNTKVVQTIKAQRVTGATTVTGGDVDAQGFESIDHVILFGQTGDTLSVSQKFDVYLDHADPDTTGGAAGTYSPVASNDYVLGDTVDVNGLFVTVDDNTEDEVAYRIAYVGPKRFTRVRVISTGTNANGTPIAAAAISGYAHRKPVG